MFPKSVFALASLFAAGTEAICAHNTDLYTRQAGAPFSYTGLTGPLNWHSLNVNNTLCSRGRQQTPINLNAGITTESGAGYVINYPTTQLAEYKNLGSTVEVLGGAINGNLRFGGTTYSLRQFHFHTPSEHRIEEEHFPLEVHFVHQAANGALAVLGFVIEIGSTNDGLLGPILSQTHRIPSEGNSVQVGPLNFNNLATALRTGTVYRYRGSLTTPPCSQGLEWIVVKQPLFVNYATYNRVKKVVKFNSRYTQNTPGQINLLENAKNTV